MKEELMLDKLSNTQQESIAKTLASAFSWQKQLVHGTIDLYEKGLSAREEGYSNAKEKVEEISSAVEKQVLSSQEKVQVVVKEIVDKYLPKSAETVEKAEELLQDSVEKITAQVKELFGENLNQGVQKIFSYEKETLGKVKELVENNMDSYQNQLYQLFNIAVPKKSTAKKPAAKKAGSKKTDGSY